MTDKLEKCLATAVNAAYAAGRMQKARLRTAFAVDFKGEANIVTEVDRDCEDLIVGIIRNEFPQSDILAEEKSYKAYDSPLKWIIDPLDGTTNYTHGFPWFCVSIALEIEGDLRVGVIYHPMMDELFTAVKGEGARLNGNTIHVSENTPIGDCLLATGFPYGKSTSGENNFDNFVNFQLSARGVRRAGAAALDLAYVAAGRLDGYWECRLNPWDVAAGTLLVREAGGTVSDIAGRPYSVYVPGILASNGRIHGEMLSILAATGKDRVTG